LSQICPKILYSQGVHCYPPASVRALVKRTSSLLVGNGNGASRTNCATEKIDVTAPMPSASVSAAIDLKLGFFNQQRGRNDLQSQSPRHHTHQLGKQRLPQHGGGDLKADRVCHVIPRNAIFRAKAVDR
jgi:hypothetical protein